MTKPTNSPTPIGDYRDGLDLRALSEQANERARQRRYAGRFAPRALPIRALLAKVGG